MQQHEPTFHAGDTVYLRPTYQDDGDDMIRWVAIDDESKGRVTIQAQLGLPINPTQVVNVEWLNPPINVEALARAFHAVICRWLPQVERDRIDQLNQHEERKTICHSHDYCDANQAMLNAIASFGAEFDTRDMHQLGIISRAWEIAKDHGFGRAWEGGAT